jgi:hypothetical protein
MKRACFLFCAIIIMGMLTLSAQEKGPKIVFDSTTKNFEKVSEGETLRHVFKFTNAGTQTLEIIRVDSSCGCTTALLSANKIAPGQSGEIEVKIETKDLAATELSKTVSVTSSDSKQPVVVLTLTAVVEPEFLLSEPSVYFGSVPRGQEATKEILVTVPPNRTGRLLSAKSEDDNVTVKIEPIAESSGKQYKIVAVQKASAAEGYHSGAIVIKTSSQLKPELKIPVRGMVLKSK